MLIKTDNEPAILSLKEEMMRRLEVGAIPVESAPHESESNGSVENGVKLFKGMLRVHLLALERKLRGQHSQSTPRDDLAGGVCGRHRDQVHARCGWSDRLRKAVWQAGCTRRVWSLVSESGGANIDLMK